MAVGGPTRGGDNRRLRGLLLVKFQSLMERVGTEACIED
jgi:hypothetical protein